METQSYPFDVWRFFQDSLILSLKVNFQMKNVDIQIDLKLFVAIIKKLSKITFLLIQICNRNTRNSND